MPNYRRALQPGGTFFFTIVTYRRRKIFDNSACVDLLREAIRDERARNPFEVEAAVILPDHVHLACRLPEGDPDYSSRIGRIKVQFTKSSKGLLGMANNDTLLQQGYSAVWQPRFWEHMIRDKDDFAGHLNYIHYNPVKHRYAKCPHEWPYSSFKKWVSRGAYAMDWCCCCDGSAADIPDFGGISPDCE